MVYYRPVPWEHNEAQQRDAWQINRWPPENTEIRSTNAWKIKCQELFYEILVCFMNRIFNFKMFRDFCQFLYFPRSLPNLEICWHEMVDLMFLEAVTNPKHQGRQIQLLGTPFSIMHTLLNVKQLWKDKCRSIVGRGLPDLQDFWIFRVLNFHGPYLEATKFM